MLTYNTRIITVYEDAIPRQDGFHEMVLDIKAAIAAAAAEGRNHYGLTPDGNDYGEGRVGDDEGVGQCRGIPEKGLHSLQTDKVIQDEDLGFIVNNMYTLRKLGVPNAPLGIAAMDALYCLHAAIVELSLHCGSTNTSQVLSTITDLAQLEVLTLDLVNIAVLQILFRVGHGPVLD